MKKYEIEFLGYDENHPGAVNLTPGHIYEVIDRQGSLFKVIDENDSEVFIPVAAAVEVVVQKKVN